MLEEITFSDNILMDSFSCKFEIHLKTEIRYFRVFRIDKKRIWNSELGKYYLCKSTRSRQYCYLKDNT